MTRLARRLVVAAAVACLAIGAMVAYGKHCIQRGARWTGVSFDRGVAFVFVCEPESRIRHALFYVWPWKKVELEKFETGA